MTGVQLRRGRVRILSPGGARRPGRRLRGQRGAAERDGILSTTTRPSSASLSTALRQGERISTPPARSRDCDSRGPPRREEGR